MKRILMIQHTRGLGGAAKSMSFIAKALKEAGYDVNVVFLFRSEALELYDNISYNVIGLPLFYFNHTAHWVRLRNFYMVFFQLISWILTVFVLAPYWILKSNPDVVYLNSSVLTDWSFCCKLLGKPNLVHIREPVSRGYFGLRNGIIKRLLNFSSSKLIFLSKHNYERLNTKKVKSHIVPNYVKDHKVNTTDLKKYDLVYVGGRTGIKGYDFVKNILRSNAELNIVLLGRYNSTFLEEFGKLNNVNVVGLTNEPLKYIAQSRFLLFPATSPHFPRPVIEAYSVGTIPIASNLEGINEIIINTKTGFVFEQGNEKDFWNIYNSLENKDLHKLKENGFKFFEENFSVKNENIIINLINDLL